MLLCGAPLVWRRVLMIVSSESLGSTGRDPAGRPLPGQPEWSRHWGCPENMDWSTIAILLQNQHARTFVIRLILFNRLTLAYPFEYIRDQNTIRGQFIIAVVGDQDFPPRDQVEDPEKNLTRQKMGPQPVGMYSTLTRVMGECLLLGLL